MEVRHGIQRLGVMGMLTPPPQIQKGDVFLGGKGGSKGGGGGKMLREAEKRA